MNIHPFESQISHPLSLRNETLPIQNYDFFNFFELWNIIANNRWLIAIITIIGISTGTVYSTLVTPVYEANILIQVEESKPGNISANGALGEAANLFEIRSPATAEMEILRSRLVVAQTVQNLQLNLIIQPKNIPIVGDWLARNAGKTSDPGFLGISGYVTGNETLAVTFFEIPTEQNTKRFSISITSSGYDLLAPSSQLLAKGKVGVVTNFTVDGREGRILVSQINANPGAQFYLKNLSQIGVVNELQRSLVIEEQGRQSGVIRTSLTGTDPIKMAKILNEIGTLYVRQNITRKSAVAEKTLGFLGTLLPELRRQVDDAASKFNQFRNRNHTFDLSTEAKVELEQSIKLQTSLLELQQKRKELVNKFTTHHPNILTIDAQIENVSTEISALNGRLKVFPDVEQELLRLTRDLKVNTELYISLLNSFQQLRLVKEGNVGNVRIVDMAAISEDPVRPKKSAVIAFFGLLGLMIGLIFAFIRNSLRPGISDPSDIEHRTGLQVFSNIPFSTLQVNNVRNAARQIPGKHVLALYAPEDEAIESLRSFRTALQFGMLGTPNNLVLISGPTSGIGKSFLSLNLAVVLGANNKKVLLLDADFRKGNINQFLGLVRENGFSEVINGNIELNDALHLQVAPNVDFLATGRFPPNPAELLSTDAAHQLLLQLTSRYDFVIMDTAPVLVASDAAILGSKVGAVFFVARAETTSLGELQESVKRLRQNGIQVKGVIFNCMRITKHQYRYSLGNKYDSYSRENYQI